MELMPSSSYGALQLTWQPAWVLLLALLGSLSVLRSSISLFRWVRASFLRAPRDLRRDYSAWAVVTDSTDGIGRALAFQLARQGLNLVLVGRDAGKLIKVAGAIKEEEVAGRIKTTAPWVETVVADFAGEEEEEVGR